MADTIFVFILGLVIGSFLNVVIHRIPRRESIVWPASHCPACLHPLKPFNLIPIISFLWLKGQCRFCKAKISWRYPLVELLTGILTVIWWLFKCHDLAGFSYLLLIYALIAIAFIDLQHRIIPNLITFPVIILGLVARAWQGELLTALIAGLIGGGVLWLINLLYPKGMGLGDVKLLAMIGVFLDWQRVISVLFAASLSGTIVISILILLKKIKRTDPFPFGPFLAAAAVVLVYLR